MTRKICLELALKAAVAIGLIASFIFPASAQAPVLPMLAGLDKGQWELRYRGSQERQRICVRSGSELIQVRHQKIVCKPTIIKNTEGMVEVHYACGNRGYGQTTIRQESSTLVQITGRGIAGNRSFEFAAEARHVGACN